jgi:hypothetical protein
MKSHIKKMTLLLLAVIGLGVSFMVLPALADYEFQGRKHKCNSIANLAAGWYEWQLANFPEFNFGEGDIYCKKGQRGKVWYFGGTGEGSVERTCIDFIPPGKRLMFPLINVVWYDDPGTYVPVAEKRIILDEIFSDIEPGLLGAKSCELFAQLDGEPVTFSGTAIQRVQSPTFTYGDPAEPDPEAVSDGFWVLLPKLSRGDHTLHFGGNLCDFITGVPVWGVDVTYHFTVGRRWRYWDDDDD